MFFPLPCLISLILNSVSHPSPRTVNLRQCASLHPLSQMSWLLMPILAGLELATLNDVLTFSSYSSVDESSFFDHNLSQPPIHTPLTVHFLLSLLGHYKSCYLWFSTFGKCLLYLQTGQRSSHLGSPHSTPTFLTLFLLDILKSLSAFTQF